jgi:hypothetical protein
VIPSEPVVRSDRADGSATRCHALRARLAGPLPDATAARWQAITGTRLWTEPVPAGSAAETARRVRNREMRRPLHAGHSLRGVLVAGEGVADLIVVARRDVLDRDDLHRLVAAITTEGPSAPSWPDLSRCDSRPATHAFSAPSWGFGDPRRGRAYGEMVLDLDPQDIADEAAWSAALSAVLARYDSPPEDSGVVLLWTGA